MKKGSCFVEDEVMPDWDQALLLSVFSIIALRAGLREAASAPRHARVLPAESPSRFQSVCVCRCRCFVTRRLASCNSPHLNIYIHTYTHSSRLVAVSMFLRVCACAKHVRCSFILLLFGYFLVQDPGGPASFSTHARNYATTRHSM